MESQDIAQESNGVKPMNLLQYIASQIPMHSAPSQTQQQYNSASNLLPLLAPQQPQQYPHQSLLPQAQWPFQQESSTQAGVSPAYVAMQQQQQQQLNALSALFSQVPQNGMTLQPQLAAYTSDRLLSPFKQSFEMSYRGAGQQTVQSSDADTRTHASQALGVIGDFNADSDIRKSHIAEKDQVKSLGLGETSVETLSNGINTKGAIETASDTQQISSTKLSSTTAGAKEDGTQEKNSELDTKTEKVNQRDQEPKIEKPEEPTATEEARVKTVVNSWNDADNKWEDRAYVVKVEENRSHHAAVFRQQMDIDNNKKVSYEEIEIHSQSLLVLLKKISHAWNDISTESDQPVIVQSPFTNVVWHWKDYEDGTKDAEGDTEAEKLAKSDLKTLLDLIKKSSALKSYFRSRDIMRVSETIKYEFLWTLFGHGTKVVARSFLNELQMFQVKDYAESPDGKILWIYCAAFDWDGTDFSVFTYQFPIRKFSGEKRIDSLTVYPAKYYGTGDAYDKLQESLKNRGKTYVKLCTQEPSMLQCEYEGMALVTPTALHRLAYKSHDTGHVSRSPYDDGVEADILQSEMPCKKSRIVVDNFSFLTSARNTTKQSETPPLGKRNALNEADCVCAFCRESIVRTWLPESKARQSLKDIGVEFSKQEERLQFLPPRLLGYALKEKVWGQFSVEKLVQIDHNAQRNKKGPFWNELELNADAKQHLMAFVEHHRASSFRNVNSDDSGSDKGMFDIIEGKGQGLVILLHGPPGVGKTLTAETIALQTGRPLLTISVTEIGVDYRLAEQNLTNVFVDAARWEAVLLMDEAEVFVEQRGDQDMEQNALVSVMLRCLEYFKGIVIMTTNRVKSIDVAIQSRVQLAIRYQDLNPAQMLKIYQGRLMRIPAEEIEDMTELMRSLEKSPLIKLRSSEEPPNGRQIRNIVTYAWALAKNEGEKLSIKHLQSVANMTLDFTESMKDLTRKQRDMSEVDR